MTFMLMWSLQLAAQPATLPMTPQRDTSNDKTNDGKWKNQEANVTFERLNGTQRYGMDTAIHTFHRRLFVQPWYRDLGNPGSPALNLLFTPENRVGPTLGYRIFDVYRHEADSVKYYNTTRPYSIFSYQAAGRQENIASIFHTQNIKPNWNIAADYRKISSPGYYQIQRNNHDNFALTSNYRSLNKHYTVYGALVYNKEQHDENGGVLDRSLLDSPGYNNRRILGTAYQNTAYSSTRSTVSNTLRDVAVRLQHSYTWGRTDTIYDENDTAAYTYTLTPRFSITHVATLGSEKHSYKDLAPDSMRYISLFQRTFPNKGTGYYSAGADSVYTMQNWVYADNKVVFNGFAGKAGNQLAFSAGAGIRYDQFISDPVSKLIADSPFYRIGYDRRSNAGTYIEGQIRKEAVTKGAWEYGASGKLFATGPYAGNFALNAVIGKKLGTDAGSFVAGAGQQLGSGPYSYTDYQNVYAYRQFQFDPESITSAYASVDLRKLRLAAGIKAYVISNFIYMDETELPTQYNAAFTLPQAWIRKVFRIGSFFLDNELVFQTKDDNTPVNVPGFMGRHQLSFEKSLFRNAIKIATGVQVRYNNAYTPAGYNAQFNRFFYQNYDTVSNMPELAVFFNFRIKRFRAFIMGDNLQQLFATNAIIYTGTPVLNRTSGDITSIPVYAMPNTMMRFGFSWAMVN